MRYLALLAALAVSGCTWSRVSVVTVVVRTSVEKHQSPDGDMDIVPQILRALPEAEEALEQYKERNDQGSTWSPDGCNICDGTSCTTAYCGPASATVVFEEWNGSASSD